MSKNTLRIAVAGDFCARNLSEKIDTAYSKEILREIQPILDSADLRLINLENAVIDGGTAIAKSGPPLKALPGNLDFLKAGNFECAVLANNHVGDYGEEGVLATMNCLGERGIAYVGAGRNLKESYRPWFRDTEAGRLAVLAVCENEFGIAGENKAGTAGYNMHRMMHAIWEAKKNADFLLVVMHGGNEHNPLPSPRVVERYRSFADLGADAVIGMHPHCMQGYEEYRGVPIAYSTGNFLFSNPSAKEEHNPWYYGYLPVITFQKGASAALELHPYRFDQACTRITPFGDTERAQVLAYIEKISKPIADASALRRYFRGWCMIGGVPYSAYLCYKPEYIGEASYPTGHPLLAIRNLYTCEAHNELMTELFQVILEGETPLAREMAGELVELQKMPV